MNQNFEIQKGKDNEGTYLKVDEQRYQLEEDADTIEIMDKKSAMTITLGEGRAISINGVNFD